MKRLGWTLFAAGMAGIGVLSLIYDDYATPWEPVPESWPLHNVLACVSGIILLAGGLGMFVKPIKKPAAFVLGLFVAGWLVFLVAPKAAATPGNEVLWLAFGETALLAAGGTVFYAALAGRDGRPPISPGAANRLVHAAYFLLAVSLPLIGLSHFVYIGAAVTFVPKWIPHPFAVARFTGAAHMAAGVGMLFPGARRPAAALEALMISLFTALIWVPAVIAAPGQRVPWTSFFISAAMAGAAWGVAASARRASGEGPPRA